MPHKHEPIYRPILRNAWRTTWQHKALWLFGMFAAFVNTGVVLNVTFRTFRRASDTDPLVNVLEGSIPGVATTTEYIADLMTVSPERAVATILAFVLMGAVIVYLGVAGQAALVKNLARRKSSKPIVPSQLVAQPTNTLAKIFAIDLVAKIVMTMVLFVSSVLFATLVSDSVFAETLINTGILLFLIPATLLVGYMSIFALIEVVEREKHLDEALFESWILLKRHWVSATEMAIILFLVNLFGVLVAVASVILFLIPYLVLFLAGIATGVSAIWFGTMFFGAFGLAVLLLVFLGFFTAFTYSAWYELHKKIRRKKLTRAKIERMITHLTVTKRV